MALAGPAQVQAALAAAEEAAAAAATATMRWSRAIKEVERGNARTAQWSRGSAHAENDTSEETEPVVKWCAAPAVRSK